MISNPTNDLKVFCLVATKTLTEPLLCYRQYPPNGQYWANINETSVHFMRDRVVYFAADTEVSANCV